MEFCIGAQCYNEAILNEPLFYLGTFLGFVGLILLVRRNKDVGS